VEEPPSVHFDPGSLAILPVCVLSLVVHECAHGWAAMACGDSTPRERGRMTLDPIPHLSAFGSLVLPACILAFHSPWLFWWARPMPVSWANLRDPRNDPVKVALAGPVASLALALVFAGLARWAPQTGFFAPLHEWCVAGVTFNCSIGLLNLVPIPPLDGSWLLMRFLRLRHIIALHHFRGLAYLVFGVLLAAPFTSSLLLGPLKLAVQACLSLAGMPRTGLAW
jgi:Zn-dependent protease